MWAILLPHDAIEAERAQGFRPLDIGPNLYSFPEFVWRTRPTEVLKRKILTMVCQEDLGHEFWIHALCIDQNNDDEKGHQV